VGLAIAFAVLPTAPALALDQPAELALGVGAFDFIDPVKPTGLVQGEYRAGFTVLWLRPFVGVEVTGEGGAYGYAGLGLDIALGDHLILTPNIGFGAWGRGEGKNLGSGAEFRTGAELDWRFDDDTRIGLEFHHLSNAGIGPHNPGEEEILAVYAFPLRILP
jgi:hypothetical protein